MTGVLKVQVDDMVTMRKPHPCGGYQWVVTRVGADVGMRCQKCGRRVMLPRDEFERRVRRVIPSPRTPSDASLWDIEP